MLIYSMGVSVDGFIADREGQRMGAFGGPGGERLDQRRPLHDGG